MVTSVEAAQAFLGTVREVVAHMGSDGVICGEAARCLWMLRGLERYPIDVWARMCRVYPAQIDVIGAYPDTAQAQPDTSAIAREFSVAMLATRVWFEVPVAGRVPLPGPAFVLAQVLTDGDLLGITRVAGLLRCLAFIQDVDLEEVRALLKAVGSGDRFEALQEVSRVL